MCPKESLPDFPLDDLDPHAIRDLFLEAPDGIVVIDCDSGKIVTCNPAFCDLAGCEAADLIGRPIAQVHPPAERELAERILRNVIEGGFASGIGLSMGWQRGGSLRPVAFLARRCRVAGREVIVASVRDHAQQAHMEAELARRTIHAQALLRLSRELERAETEEAVADAVARQIHEVLSYGHCSLFDFPPQATECVRIAIRSVNPDLRLNSDIRKIPLTASRIVQDLASGRSPVVVEDARTDPRTNKDYAKRLKVVSLIHVSARTRNGGLIVMSFGTLTSEGPRVPDTAGLQFAGAVVAQATAAIDRLRLDRARTRAEEAMKDLLSGTAQETGNDFFEALTRQLCKSLGVSSALVCRISRDFTMAHPLAFYSRGRSLTGHPYPLAGTPCKAAIDQGAFLVRSNVQEEFPEDKELVLLDANAYAGRVLVDGQGHPIGHLCILHDDVLVDEILIQELLDVFARRAAGELMRLQAEERLARSLSIQELMNRILRISVSPETFKDRMVDILECIRTAPVFSGGGRISLTLFPRDAAKRERLTVPKNSPPLEDEPGSLCVPIRSGEDLLAELRVQITEPRRRGRLLEVFIESVAGTLAGILEREVSASALSAAEEAMQRSQKLEALGRLAGGIAHDFNNLLTSILGSGELLLDQVAPEARELAESIVSTARNASGLTRQLLAFTRGQPLEHCTIDLNQVVRDAANVMRRLLPDGIVLRSRTAENPLHVMAPRGQLMQVTTNLLVNAVDATGGQGVIHLETRLAAKKDTTQPHAMIEVRDDGMGIDQETQKMIFEPFFTTKGVGKGTGLGLSVAYGIVTQLQGSITVRSAPGEGAVFRVELPLASESEITPVPAAPKAERPRRLKRILLVEDEDSVRLVTFEMLKRLGREVVACSGGEEALEAMAKSAPFDAAIVDVSMPGMTGLDFHRYVVETGIVIPFLFVTGYDPTEELAELTGISGVAILRKPFGMEELADKLDELDLASRDHPEESQARKTSRISKP